MDWAKRIKDYRGLAGVKQQALADALGVDRTTISRWENGREVPALVYRKRILALTPERDEGIVRGLIDTIDNLDGFATLLDSDFRIVRTSRQHQRVMKHDPTELYGRSSEPFWSEQMEKIIRQLGGLRGYRKLGIHRMDLTITRKPYERGARNAVPLMTIGRTSAIGDPREPVCYFTTLRLVEADEAPAGCSILGLDGEIAVAV